MKKNFSLLMLQQSIIFILQKGQIFMVTGINPEFNKTNKV